jgi:ADP-ribose pyrophosphatase
MPLPPNAKKVFDGVIFDVYQWEQEMFDGSTETFEMLKRPGTLLVIPERDGKILIADQEQPVKGSFLSLLGGRQEPDETPLEGAKRELKEESGLVSDHWEPLFETQPYNKVDWTISTFIARDCKQTTIQNTDAGEKITVLELDFDEFINTVLSDRFCGHELVEKILRMKLDPKKMEAFKKKLLG